MYRIKNFFQSVKNLFIWFPTIWKIRYWDYGYGVDLFIKYLYLLRKGIIKYQNHVNWEHDIATLDRFLKMYTFQDDLGYFKRYEDILKSEGLPTIEEILEKGDKHLTSVQRIRMDELHDEYIEKENRLHDILWAYLKQNMYRWWD